MPIRTTIDSDTGFRCHVVTGSLSPEGLKEALEEIYDMPDYRPGSSALWDFTAADVDQFDPAAVRGAVEFVAAKSGAPPGTRTALVVAKDVTYGLGRMYEQLLSASIGSEVMVFRDVDKAGEWLERVPAT